MTGKKGEYAFFSVVVLALSAFFLCASLLMSLKLQSIGDKTEALFSQCSVLEEENRILTVRLEQSLDLEDLEDYAVNVLKMHRADCAEIYHLERVD